MKGKRIANRKHTHSIRSKLRHSQWSSCEFSSQHQQYQRDVSKMFLFRSGGLVVADRRKARLGPDLRIGVGYYMSSLSVVLLQARLALRCQNGAPLDDCIHRGIEPSRRVAAKH